MERQEFEVLQARVERLERHEAQQGTWRGEVNAVNDAPWTFNPVYPEVYPTISPKVIVVAPEPNDNGRRPDRDMGLWFRTAAAKGYWGNPLFYQETLRQVQAVLGDKPDNEILQHVRYVDLKALGGDGSADKDEVATWVRGHLAQVTGYWLNDRPAYTIVQGKPAQEVFEELVVPVLRVHNVEGLKVGLLHPSQQNMVHLNDPAYLAALKEVHKHLSRLDEPLVRWVRRSKENAAHWA